MYASSAAGKSIPQYVAHGYSGGQLFASLRGSGPRVITRLPVGRSSLRVRLPTCEISFSSSTNVSTTFVFIHPKSTRSDEYFGTHRRALHVNVRGEVSVRTPRAKCTSTHSTTALQCHTNTVLV